MEPCKRTGRGTRVAVIDSGLALSNPAIRDNIRGGVRIGTDEGGSVLYQPRFEDDTGHGTVCASIITGVAPDVELYGIKILDKELKATTAELAAGIEWATDNRMKVVNMSVMVRDGKGLPVLEKACGDALKKGLILVAPGHEDERTYPACLPGMIRVHGFRTGRGGFSFWEKDGVLWFSARRRYSVPWSEKKYYCGSSFSAARIAGLVSLIVEEHPDADAEKIIKILTAYKEGV